MFPQNTVRNSGWFIVFCFVGASILASCSERPDFTPRDESTGSGGAATGGDGDGNTGSGGDATTGDGDGDGNTGSGGGATTGDGDCEEGELDCDGSCVDPYSDEDYCGASGSCTDDEMGEQCVSPMNCVDGACGFGCGSSEVACGDTCVDVEADLSNCGSCGNACATPGERGSSAVCEDGECGACGAYSQDCCGTSCGTGFVCAGGTCECQVGNHYCSSGNAAGSCADDDDINNCGSTCADCNQPNAQPTCVNDACANTCPAGIATLCPAGSDGKPSCGNWNFESNDVEGWAYDAASSEPTFAPGDASVMVGNEGRYGSYSLAVPFDSTSIEYGRVIVRVPLCGSGQAVDVTGKTITAFVRFVTAAGSPALADSEGANAIYLYSGPNNPRGGGSGFQVNKTTGGDSTPGSWLRVSLDVDAGFALAADIPPAATHLGFSFSPHPWKGTIYIDRVEIN